MRWLYGILHGTCEMPLVGVHGVDRLLLRGKSGREEAKHIGEYKRGEGKWRSEYLKVHWHTPIIIAAEYSYLRTKVLHTLKL